MAKQNELMWGLLLHISYNMWSDRECPEWGSPYITARPYLRFDESLWNSLLIQAVAAGVNTILLDLGDGVEYHSHPEIAVKGAWSREKLKTELARMRGLGLTPLPKLNFSACHDTWLGPYARMVSTETYYQVCRDLISEVSELFDGPVYFHLGMDEETAEHQRYYEYVLVRQGNLWWHDLNFYVEQVQQAGARGWVWSDYVWKHPEEYYRLMPRNVLQSNWYYGTDLHCNMARAYDELELHGYEQVPTGSNWEDPANMRLTVEHCQQVIQPERLVGYLMSVWKPTLEECRARHEQAIACIKEARQVYLAGLKSKEIVS
ncbi:MAG: Tat pathway signal protein [Anaerolineae bacterium]